MYSDYKEQLKTYRKSQQKDGPEITLTYFNGRARGEPIRMAFAFGGIEFTDNRISFEEWPPIKAAGKIYVQFLVV